VAPWHTAETKWGYVFQNNVIRAHRGVNVTDVWLGRPWHGEPKTVFINTQTFVNIPAKGWYNTMGGLPSLWADYNTVDAQGQPLDLSQREDTYYYMDGDQRVEGKAKNYLTAEEAAQYTLKNVVGGTDNWQPDLMCEACEAPVVTAKDGQLSWQPVPYAICYVVSCNGQVVGFTTETSYPEMDGRCQVQAVNEYGGLSAFGEPNAETGILTVPGGSSPFPVARYGLSGRPVASSHRGLQLVRHADGTVSKVLR
jgi:hypothetical protein